MCFGGLGIPIVECRTAETKLARAICSIPFFSLWTQRGLLDDR